MLLLYFKCKHTQCYIKQVCSYIFYPDYSSVLFFILPVLYNTAKSEVLPLVSPFEMRILLEDSWEWNGWMEVLIANAAWQAVPQNALNSKVTKARPSSNENENNNLIHSFESCKPLKSQEWSDLFQPWHCELFSLILSFMYKDPVN